MHFLIEGYNRAAGIGTHKKFRPSFRRKRWREDLLPISRSTYVRSCTVSCGTGESELFSSSFFFAIKFCPQRHGTRRWQCVFLPPPPLLLPISNSGFCRSVGSSGGKEEGEGGGHHSPSSFRPCPCMERRKGTPATCPRREGRRGQIFQEKKCVGNVVRGEEKIEEEGVIPRVCGPEGGCRGLPTFSTLKDYHLCNN